MKLKFEIDLDCSCKKRKHGIFNYNVGIPIQKTEVKKMLELATNNEQKVKVTLNPGTPGGKPAQVDGVPTWVIQSGNSTVQVAEDGLSAYLVSSDNPGDTTILVNADADLGEGVTDISDVILYHVEGAKAASLGLSAGPAEPK